MATPMAIAGMGMTALGGIVGAKGAEVSAQGQQLGIQGQMMNTMAQIFGLQTQAQQYQFGANRDRYQRDVAETNKTIALQNATYARDVGETSAQAQGMKDRAAEAQFTASRSASGIDIHSGSTQRVKESMVDLSQFQQATSRANYAKVAYGYEAEATNDEAQAQLYDYTASMEDQQAANSIAASKYAANAIPLQQQAWNLAGQAGDISALGSLLGAGSSVASKWSKLGQT